MLEGKRIGIIISHCDRNRLETLKRAVKSVLKQTYKNFKIIIVRDDENLAKDREYWESFTEYVWQELRDKITYYENLTHIINNDFKGRSNARNIGIRKCVELGCDLVCFLDDDDYFLKDHLNTLVTEINKGYDIVYSDAARHVNGRRELVYSEDFDYQRLLIDNYIPNLCLMFKTEIFKYNQFNPQFDLLEDWELWIRVCEKAKVKHICKTTAVYNYGHNTTEERKDDFWKYRMMVWNESIDKWRNNLMVRKSIQKIFCEIIKNENWRYTNLQQISISQDKSIRKLFNELGLYKDKPIVSIIILTLNNLKYTKECLNSLLEGTDRSEIDYELILVDNGSDDGTVEYLKELSEVYDFIKVILNNENMGFAKGNNLGMSVSTGRYILLLNNDVVVSKDFLRDFTWTMRWFNNEILCEYDLLGAVSNYASGKQQVTVEGMDLGNKELNTTVLNTYYGLHNLEEIIPSNKLIGFCLLFKREVMDKIGGLDERFLVGNWEDDDFCLRARMNGFKLGIVPSVFVWHYGSMTFRGQKIDYNELIAENRVKFMKKYGLWKEGMKHDEVIEALQRINNEDFVEELKQREKDGLLDSKYLIMDIRSDYSNNYYSRKKMYGNRLDMDLQKKYSREFIRDLFRIMTGDDEIIKRKELLLLKERYNINHPDMNNFLKDGDDSE